MNAKLLFKTIFLMLIVLLLVMIGMNNPSTVPFSLPPIVPKTIKQPAAIMYVTFFALGFISGTIITAGGGKKGGSGASAPKPAKAK